MEAVAGVHLHRSVANLRRYPQVFGLALVILLFNAAHYVLPATFVLYADYRYQWGEQSVGYVLGVDCPPDALCSPSRGSCTPTACSTDKDCSGGTTCQADPTDPCSQPGVMCAHYAPVRTVCLPATTPATRCTGLDEKRCSSSGCKAVFGASACAPDGTCTTDMVFKRCE